MHSFAKLHIDGPADAARIARAIVRRATSATLSHHPSAHEVTESVVVAAACLADGRPVFGISTGSELASDIANSAPISLSFDGPDTPESDASGLYFRLEGKAHKTEDGLTTARLRRRFPELHGIANDQDLIVLELEPSVALLRDREGEKIEIEISQYILDVSDGEAEVKKREGKNLRLNEQEALDHMNGDHPEIALALATKLLGRPAGSWKFTGFDPEGCDLQMDDDRQRIDFSRQVLEFASLKLCMKELLTQPEAK